MTLLREIQRRYGGPKLNHCHDFVNMWSVDIKRHLERDEVVLKSNWSVINCKGLFVLVVCGLHIISQENMNEL